jgi:hypothetical protein
MLPYYVLGITGHVAVLNVNNKRKVVKLRLKLQIQPVRPITLLGYTSSPHVLSLSFCCISEIAIQEKLCSENQVSH